MAKRAIMYKMESGGLGLRDLEPDEPVPEGYVFMNDMMGTEVYSWPEHVRATRDLVGAADDESIEEKIEKNASEDKS